MKTYHEETVLLNQDEKPVGGDFEDFHEGFNVT